MFRRLSFLVPGIAVTAVSVWLAFAQMRAHGGFSPLEGAMLVLLALSTGYVTLQAWQAVLGFLCLVLPRRDGAAAPAARIPLDARRLAVVMPICDEDVAAVFGAIAVVRHSMGLAGLAEAQVFVLSDSRGGAAAGRERAAFEASARSTADRMLPELRYRHRALNLLRKAGNIADFCTVHGHSFDFMLVLDADSLMSGTAIRRMAEMMAADPRLGLVQSVCYPARRTTLFARIQQFAAALYAPLHTAGMQFWSDADGIYWGHNALIRVAPFMAACKLPLLPGRPPLGGEILCHDVVEAAFLRRAGWDVRLLTDLPGTWEDLPSNTIDFAVRDRRWCQGNLQHSRLLGEDGLTWPCRYHFLNGIFAYVSAPVWLAFLALGTAQIWLGTDGRGEAGGTLLTPAVAAPVLFWLSLSAVFLPKLLSLLRVLASGTERRRFGGGVRLCVGAVAETLFGLLWSQMSLLFYSQFVVATLMGRPVAWDPQARGDRGVGWMEAVLRHRWHVALGLLWGSAVWQLDETVFWWMSPIFAGLVLSIPLTVFSSRTSCGLAAERLGLFLTPDETAPAPELIALPGEIERVAAVLRNRTGDMRAGAADRPRAIDLDPRSFERPCVPDSL